MTQTTSSRPGSPEDWAQRHPDRIAFIDPSSNALLHRLTFAEWNSLANNLAHHLLNSGLQADDIVAIRMHNRMEWPILHLALAKIGCRILGVNWRLTADEMAYVIDHSDAKVFVCDDAHLPNSPSQTLIKQASCLQLALHTGQQEVEGFQRMDEWLSPTNQQPLFSRGEPRLIIYTSGTTGKPKGVESGLGANISPEKITELREYMLSSQQRHSIDNEVVLVTMPMHHSAGPNIIRSSARRGCPQVLLDLFEAETVLRLIEQFKITTWNGVPTMFKRLSDLPKDILNRYDTSSIEALSVGAAPVSGELKNWILNRFGPVLSEGYGATEVGMITQLSPDMMKKKPGSSGRPLKHVRISIRDSEGNELPTDQTGEIWVYTPVGIRHYLNADDLDQNTRDSEGFFRMGDVGHLDSDGYLYITDRSKDMIISGGVNIYPAEIESVLCQHPAVDQCAVIGIPDTDFGEAVLAFCTLKSNQDISSETLLDWSATSLASYKRPREIRFIEQLPTNDMGKILKRELRDPFWNNKEISV